MSHWLMNSNSTSQPLVGGERGIFEASDSGQVACMNHLPNPYVKQVIFTNGTDVCHREYSKLKSKFIVLFLIVMMAQVITFTRLLDRNSVVDLNIYFGPLLTLFFIIPILAVYTAAVLHGSEHIHSIELSFVGFLWTFSIDIIAGILTISLLISNGTFQGTWWMSIFFRVFSSIAYAMSKLALRVPLDAIWLFIRDKLITENFTRLKNLENQLQLSPVDPGSGSCSNVDGTLRSISVDSVDNRKKSVAKVQAYFQKGETREDRNNAPDLSTSLDTEKSRMQSLSFPREPSFLNEEENEKESEGQFLKSSSITSANSGIQILERQSFSQSTRRSQQSSKDRKNADDKRFYRNIFEALKNEAEFVLQIYVMLGVAALFCFYLSSFYFMELPNMITFMGFSVVGNLSILFWSISKYNTELHKDPELRELYVKIFGFVIDQHFCISVIVSTVISGFARFLSG